MKKFVISLIVASAVLFGIGSPTSAQYGGAPTPPPPDAVDSEAEIPTAVSPAGAAPSAGLPTTGSDGIGMTTGIAAGLLTVGLGLFIVTRVRRRHPVALA